MKKTFNNLKLAAKLGLGFGLCLVLALAVGLSSIASMGKMNDATSKMSQDVGALNSVADLNVDLLQYIRGTKNLILSDSDADNKKYATDVTTFHDQVNKDIEILGGIVYTAQGKATQKQIADSWKEYAPFHEKVMGLALQNKGSEAQKVSLQGRSIFGKIEKTIEDFRELKKKHVNEKKDIANATASSASKIAITLLSLAIVIGIAISLYLTKSISSTLSVIAQRFKSIQENDVNQLTQGLVALSKGNLTVHAEAPTVPIALGTKDEFGNMADTFDAMLSDLKGAVVSYNEARESLTELVRDLSENSASVASTSQTLAAAAEQSGAAASEIAAGSEKLAKSATDTAAIVEELIAQVNMVGNSSKEQATLVTESGATLDRAASGIGEVASSAQNMAAAAHEGNKAVSETVEAMARVQQTVALSASKVKDLDQKGQEIGNIVVTIEQIAEQTNLLALNAAIEAARAGDHGRGFAVVADEVRKLAEESRTATKQIASLISSVRTTVEETVQAIEGTTIEAKAGTERSQQAGKALEEILSNAEQVAIQAESVAKLTLNATSSMESISRSAHDNASASTEMSSGAESVGSSISGVAAVSEESAAGAEELNASIEEVSAAAGELAKMSQDLESIVARFEIEKTGTARKSNLKLAA